jgi:cytidylate kinase
MSRQGLLNRLPHVLEHARAQARIPENTADQAPVVTIAISREAGIDSAAIAHQVGKLLNWPVYDHELLERIAEEMGLRPDCLERVDERPVRWLVERLETFLSAPTVSEPRYLEHLIATLLSLAAHGHCVVVGRGAAHLLPPETTLRVRLMAPLKARAEASARTLGIQAREAARRLAEVDRARDDFVRQHFHQDSADAHNYDTILNCERFGPSQCAELIVKALGLFQASRDQSTTPAVAASPEMTSFEAIEAELAEHFET